MPISYATTPLPANGLARTAASEAAIFNNIATTYNAFESATNAAINANNGILAARSFAATPSYIAQRDSNGDIQFRDSYVRSLIATGLIYGTATKPLTDAFGFVRSDALPVIPSYLLDQLNPYSTVAMQLNWGAGMTTDANGNAHAVVAGSRVFNDIPSPATQAYWALVYVNETTGVVATIYAPATDTITPTPVLPVGCKAIADVYFPVNAAGIISTRALWTGGTQPFFLDGRFRNFFGSTAASGGSGTGTSASNAVVIAPQGTTAGGMLTQTGVTTPANLVDLWAGVATGTINGVNLATLRMKEGMVAGDSTQATLDDYLSVAVSGSIRGALQAGAAAGTLALRVPNGQPPITARISGKRFRFNAGTVYNSNAVVANGAYILAADNNGVGPESALQLVSSLGVNQIALIKVWWDGVAFYFASPHGPYYMTLAMINGYNYEATRPNSGYFAATALAATGNNVLQIPGAPTITLFLADGGMKAHLHWWARSLATTATGDVRTYAMSSVGSGAALGAVINGYSQWSLAPINSILPGSGYARVDNLGPGPVNFSVGYYASIAGFGFSDVILEVEITR